MARSIATPKPIMFTGAMRTSHELGWDGPVNLLDSVRVAASPRSRGQGVLVVFGGSIFRAARRDQGATLGFRMRSTAQGSAPLARWMARPSSSRRWSNGSDAGTAAARGAGRHRVCVCRVRRPARDAAREEGVGLVLGALRPRKHQSPISPLSSAGWRRARPWWSPRVPIAAASGRSTDSAEVAKTLHDAGAIFAGGRRPQQARIDLMLASRRWPQRQRLAAVFERGGYGGDAVETWCARRGRPCFRSAGTAVVDIAERLEARGYETWCVGGRRARRAGRAPPQRLGPCDRGHAGPGDATLSAAYHPGGCPPRHGRCARRSQGACTR